MHVQTCKKWLTLCRVCALLVWICVVLTSFCFVFTISLCDSDSAIEIGSNSCQGNSACLDIAGGPINIFDDSCNGDNACRDIVAFRYKTYVSIIIGPDSCDASGACNQIGEGQNAEDVHILSGSCRGASSCSSLGNDATGILIGTNSCTSNGACQGCDTTGEPLVIPNNSDSCPTGAPTSSPTSSPSSNPSSFDRPRYIPISNSFLKFGNRRACDRDFCPSDGINATTNEEGCDCVDGLNNCYLDGSPTTIVNVDEVLLTPYCNDEYEIQVGVATPFYGEDCASGADCFDDPLRGGFKIDLTGTGYQFATCSIYVYGDYPRMRLTIDGSQQEVRSILEDDVIEVIVPPGSQVVEANCGGFCAECSTTCWVSRL